MPLTLSLAYRKYPNKPPITMTPSINEHLQLYSTASDPQPQMIPRPQMITALITKKD